MNFTLFYTYFIQNVTHKKTKIFEIFYRREQLIIALLNLEIKLKDVKSGNFEYFLKLKKMLGEVDIFEQTNSDFTDEFSNFLSDIKV